MPRCKSCAAEIRFVPTVAGKTIPLDTDRKVVFTISRDDEHREVATGITGFESHFATCPNAAEHRREP